MTQELLPPNAAAIQEKISNPKAKKEYKVKMVDFMEKQDDADLAFVKDQITLNCKAQKLKLKYKMNEVTMKRFGNNRILIVAWKDD